MIDTIILTIPENQFITITNDKTLNWDLHSKSGVFCKYVKNQTAQQKHDEIYRPRVRFIKRGRQGFLQMEFSIPKLLYGNNIDEVEENDFEEIIITLQKRLKDFGIITQEEVLKQSIVSSIHPSKNITLSDGYTSSFVIKELNKINLTKKMDLDKNNFRNNGESLQLYANSNSFVIYDKIADLKKPKGRAIDKDKTFNQPSLFEQMNNKGVLRFEIRLSKKVKVNSVLIKLGYKKNITFQEVFKKEICQKIVKMYWEKFILNENMFLFSLLNNPQDILKKIIQNDSNIKPKQMIYLVGLHELCRDKQGIRGLRTHIEKQSNPRTWQRIAGEIKNLNPLFNISECHNWINQINNQLDKFESLKIYALLCKEK